MNDFAFTDDFLFRAAQAGREVRLEGDAWVVFNGGGEIRNYVRESGLGYVLSGAERAEPERELMCSKDMLDIERYLTYILGDDYRAHANLPLIVPRLQEEAVGYGVETREGVLGLVGADGDSRVLWLQPDSSVSRQKLREFSYYADASPADIWDSMTAASGAPLFEDFIRLN